MDPEALKELEYPTPRHLAVLDEAASSKGDSVYNSREISIDRMALKRIIRHGLQSTTQTRSFFALLRAKHKELSAQNERFILTESGFERQFAQTYFCRFHELKPHLVESAQHKWPEIPSRQYRIVFESPCSVEDSMQDFGDQGTGIDRRRALRNSFQKHEIKAASFGQVSFEEGRRERAADQ